MRKIRTAVLISGRGSNMAALATAAKSEHYPANISLVISNNPNAGGLAKAGDLGVTSMTIDHNQFSSRRKFEMALDAALSQAGIELVCCAGFMRVLTPWFVDRWKNRLLNIHPSLLPKYKGLNTHQRAIDAGDKEHGCTVHYVTAELDGGAAVLQYTLDIKKSDTADSLAQRLLPHEQKLYVKALKKVATELLSLS